MGLFSKFLRKEGGEEKHLYYAQQEEIMTESFQKARSTFKYFWSELYWEYRRIVPAHDLAIVKILFEQTLDGLDKPVEEHMWINNIEFDGENLSGNLINSPNQLTNISLGDRVSTSLDKISDWMFAIGAKTFGGFTVQLLRSEMSRSEREDHDKAWGLDFGDYNNVLLVYEQEEHPENLIEHPMSRNMADEMRKFSHVYRYSQKGESNTTNGLNQ